MIPMPKTKEFQIHYRYYANYGSYERSREEESPVKVSDYAEIKSQLLDRAQDPDGLKQLLRSEFIYEKELARRVHDAHNSFQYFSDGTGQCDTYTFATHKVASVLEELVTNHPEDFRSLLAKASPESQIELLNFTDLDLANANLEGLDYSKINFTRSDIKALPALTQALLDASKTYVDAQLPQGMIPFWNEDKKKAVLRAIKELEDYGKSLETSVFKDARVRGVEATKLAKQLTAKINSASKYNGEFQKDVLTALRAGSATFNTQLDHGLTMLMANIALCILGVGIGYAAALVVHHQQTGRYLFFSRPETAAKAAAIEDSISPALGA
jgi:uncharacterized protein YjbI with pentapeptide repeats